ncbi:MAG: hypothetical protein N3A69_14465 [Leptospiraceae bacterium]|nr:hypothetical protein [Leptospiraceae bacterium]
MMSILKVTLVFLLVVAINCNKKDNDNKQRNLLFFALAANSQPSIAAQFPNVVVGNPQAIKAVSSVSSAASSAINSASTSVGVGSGLSIGGIVAAFLLMCFL